MLVGPLYSAEFGNSERETLVLLHGGGASRWVWNPVAAELMDEFHLLVPDLLEHGRSGGTFSIRHNAKLVAELIALRGHGAKAHVVGLSIGAQIGLELLAHFPQSVSSALLSSPLTQRIPGLALLSDARWDRAARALMSRYMRGRTYAPLVRANQRALSIPARYYPELLEDTARLSLDGFMRMMRENLNYRCPDALERVQVPTLLTVSSAEPPAIGRSVDQVAARIPGARAVNVPGAVHNWNLQKPELYAQTVRTWIREQSWPAELEQRPTSRGSKAQETPKPGR